MGYLAGLPEAGASGPREREASAEGDRLVAERVFPVLADWRPVLDRLRIPAEIRAGLAAAAEANLWTLGDEIVARGIACETTLYRAFADSVGMEFQGAVDPCRLILDQDRCILLLSRQQAELPVKQESPAGQTTYLLPPVRTGIGRIRGTIEANPALRRRLHLVAPSVLRDALRSHASSLLLRAASIGLFERFPHLSARFVLNPWQGGVVGALAILLPLAVLFRPAETLLAVHILATVFFIGCVGLRMAASRSAGCRVAELPARERGEDLPVYSVLVALYKEKEVVPQLVGALGRLDWPHGKLDVKLICEADDGETIGALRAARLPPFMEVVEVPPGHPRTKPKALNYALPMARGELVVLFDAEDRPDPGQLREAWQAFRRSGPELACVQAPLRIANGEAGLVPRMFAFEYSALFCGLLPFLARHRLPLPLGGTSNHFRRAALLEAGGWDPFNVTEDADLAVRLARFGFRTAIITRPTLEDAPERWGVWLPQRTRWFKGYIQSWLVHMRDPLALLREIGPLAFLTVQIVYAGLVVSSLVHPFLVATMLAIAAAVLMEHEPTALEAALMVTDAVNIFLGYAMFLLLGWRSTCGRDRRAFGRVVLGLPLYWLMLSVAAWLALWQLWLRPHHWSKTPHKQTARPPDAFGLVQAALAE